MFGLNGALDSRKEGSLSHDRSTPMIYPEYPGWNKRGEVSE